ncbi:hypothetical protein [Fodinibius sp. AD559]|uniref:hypothetical protein n=1 Tax=Fodinibius sp. AD559 TaxID=3424179 RepID=UPI0040468B46
MINESVKEELFDKLERVLKHLDFSEIQIEKHPEYPSPKIHHNILGKEDYTPPFVASKNEVTYYFEFIDGNPLVMDKNKHFIRKLINLGDQQWDADFVFVTKYGHKDRVREWCEKNNLSVDQIWEM